MNAPFALISASMEKHARLYAPRFQDPRRQGMHDKLAHAGFAAKLASAIPLPALSFAAKKAPLAPSTMKGLAAANQGVAKGLGNHLTSAAAAGKSVDKKTLAMFI